MNEANNSVGSRHEHEVRSGLKCPLCGFEFSREEMKCRGCPVSTGTCNTLCCPNCNYQFVEESKIVNFFTKKILQSKIFRRERKIFK
ncbi:MAG: hypothetical protein ABH874_07240 [Methanobacteriota archaeon]